MINTLRVDLKRYMMTKSFLIFAVVIAIVYPVASEVGLQLLSGLINEKPYVNTDNFAYYSSIAAFYLAVISTIFLHTEVGEGIVRNKLISGKKRYEIFFSYCMVNSAIACVLQVLSVAVVALVAVILGENMLVTFSEAFRFTWVTALAGVAISVLYTASYLCFCTKKMAIAIPLAIAMFMKIISIVIMDALFTPSGIPKVSGVTLKIYEGIDRYLAFFHLNGSLRYDNTSYLIGNIVIIIVSLLVGSIVFTKKDLQ